MFPFPSFFLQISSSEGNGTVLSLTLTGKFIDDAKKLLIDNNGLVFREDLAKVYARILDSIRPTDPSLCYMPMPLESQPEFFTFVELKTSTATYDLVVLKHFYTSLSTGEPLLLCMLLPVLLANQVIQGKSQNSMFNQ